MPLRLVIGENAAVAWAMPDDSIVFVKLTQPDYLAHQNTLDSYRKPDPNARFLMAVGGMPMLDTADGYPSPGDYWEMSDGTLHYQTGPDLFGEWGCTQTRQKIVGGRVATDPVSGKPMMEYTRQISATHREHLINYDLKTIAQYVPQPASRSVSFAVVDVPAAIGGVINGL